MRVSKLGNLLVAATVGLPLLLAAACSDDPVVPATAKPVQTCPANLDRTSGAACSDSAVTCDFPLMCPGGLDQQVRCACDGTTFNCVYRGEAVPKGQVPACKPSIGVNGADCPASVQATEGKACTSTGQLCSFSGLTCADGTQNMDTCRCAPGDGGFRFTCNRKLCPSEGGPPPPVEAGSDADGGPDGANGG